MLLKSKVHTLDSLREIIMRVSRELYEGNLVHSAAVIRFARDGSRHIRFTLETRSSFGHGSRLSASGRHMPKASWHAHKEVMDRIFQADPKAFLHTALADYRGREDYRLKYQDTGERNAGSMMNPARLRDLSV